MPWLRSVVMVFVFVSVGLAADWPQWLGPTRDNVSSETVIPWKESPKVIWRQPVGEGHSSPVVADGKVFLHTKIKDKDAEELTAFDAVQGKVLWQTPIERIPFKSLFGNGPRATPLVADGKVYTYGITGVLTCLDAQKGSRVWQVDALKDFSAKNLFFGASCSPLFEDGKLLINVGGPGAGVVAFKREDGAVAWKCLDDKASYASPIVIGQGAARQAIFLTQAGLKSVNPATGNLWWHYPLADRLLESSTTPLLVSDMLIASSITYGSVGLKLEVQDGKPGFKEVWKAPELTCYFSTPVVVGTEHVYMVTGTNPLGMKKMPEASLQCLEAKTGKVLWSRPKVGKYHVALLRTGDGKILMLDDSSTLILLEPSLKEYKELARAKICGETWAHPALANGRLYLRDDKELICLQLGAPQGRRSLTR